MKKSSLSYPRRLRHIVSLLFSPVTHSSMTIVLLLTLVFIFFACNNSDYPYYIKKPDLPCIGLQYDEDRALLLYSYTESTYGHPSVKEYLEEAGVDVISFDMLVEDQSELTVDYLEENEISQIWLFSSCGGAIISEDTVDMLFEFSEMGGSLAILADNHPCINDCIEIAERFDVSFEPSPTIYVDLLSKDDGTLMDHCITKSLDSLQGGVTPSDISYPTNDDNYEVIGEKNDDTLFVVLENDKTRVFFDSAWTRYDFEDPIEMTLNPDTQKFIDNIVDYLQCKCN